VPKSYQPVLVVLSALIALWGAYDALRLGGRVSVADPRARRIWVIAGAMALGIGIWSMHFVGMLALQLPVSVRYESLLIILSLVVAIAGSAGAFAGIGSQSPAPFTRWAAAASMAVAISGMHYTAMAGMRLPAEMHYNPSLVLLSIAISFASPFAALWLLPAVTRDQERTDTWSKGLPAVFIAAGIVAMHYTAMAAVRFTPASPLESGVPTEGLVATPGLAVVIAVGTGLMLGMAELGVVISRREDEYLVQLRALTARIEAAREEERTRIAREIHDEVGQALTALQLDLGWMRRTPDPGYLTAKIDEMARLLTNTQDALGRLAAGLRPPVLDQLGLGSAVRALAQDFALRTGIPHHIDIDEDGTELDHHLATSAYRIVQEALTNVARHAQPTRVDIVVRITADELRVEVRDNGRGITAEELADRPSLGLLGMQERARSWGGEVVISGSSGRGTTVRVTIPLREAIERSDTP
jgi:signal transduction histidine kinase